MIRAEAKALGRKYYETGLPCKHGHIAPRQTANGNCTACVKLKKPIRDKMYRERNHEKVLSYDRLRHQKNPTSRRVSAEKLKAAKQRYYQKHKERLLKQCAERRAEKRESLREYFKTYRKNNVAEVVADRAKRRAALKQRVPVWVDSEQLFLIKEAYDLAQRRRAVTGFEWHVDHVVPLLGKTVSGLHGIENLRVVPAQVNLKKTNKHLEEHHG